MTCKAKTIREAVTEAINEYPCADDYWEIHLEKGPLHDACIRNWSVPSRYETLHRDVMKMGFCTKHGRIFQEGWV